MPGRGRRMYTCAPPATTSRVHPMQAQQIRNEVTALQARYDALRGYL